MRICSITPHQLLNNPRLVREADALADAGHDVRVIAVKMLPDQSARDDELVRGRQRTPASAALRAALRVGAETPSGRGLRAIRQRFRIRLREGS